MYQTVVDGKHYELGTSGFLYRSNKLMYDHETKSLWSTLDGKPVVGKLVGKGVQLKSRHLVTTTWGEWKQRHPDTAVLSLETGHRRDYGEGVAYKAYFSNDRLMFAVPQTDNRMKNKDEVLIPRIGSKKHSLAISTEFLKENPIYHGTTAGVEFVVLTDPGGANRIYEAPTARIESYDQHSATDMAGTKWQVTEDSLTSQDGKKVFLRLPAHRAFWFGWHAQNPKTKLITD